VKHRRKIFFLALLMACASLAQEPLVFDSPEQEARYLQLTKEFRCLVCQNQNLADSDAPLAHDLRKEIQEMLQAGSTDNQIRAFLVDRYGDFVLYRPPVKANTIALWTLPALLLCSGALIVLFAVRRQKRQPPGDGPERED
jgi:cytochrome c-type biogenesis protein CcmH